MSTFSGEVQDARSRFSVPAELGAIVNPDTGVSERDRFCDFLSSVDPSLAALADLVKRSDPTFLVALYRLLPEARPQLYQGLVQEVVQVQNQILSLLAEMQSESATSETLGQPNVLAAALIQAGLANTVPDARTETTTVAGEDIDHVEELIGFVMVPGKFNLAVPLDLLLRVADPSWSGDVPRLLEKHDLFRWPQSDTGRLLVSARNSEEARMFVHSRFADPRAEVEFACRLIASIHADGGDRGELDFAIKLIQSMGPSGRDPRRYVSHLRGMAQTLQDLRESTGILSPRLMLQEANLLREWVKNHGNENATKDECLSALNDAEDVLLEALDTAESQNNKQLTSALRTELADVHATGMRLVDEAGAPTMQGQYNVVYDHVKRAMAVAPDNYHALDILSWCTFQCMLPRDGASLSEQQMEALVDLAHLLDGVNPADLPFESRELYNRRRMELSRFLRDNKLNEEAFAALDAMGSTAGYYLRASEIAGSRLSEGSLTPARYESCHRAAEYLEMNRVRISRDARCLSFLLAVWWIAHTGRRLFFQDATAPERQCLALDGNDWDYCLRLIDDAMRADPVMYQENPYLHYIRGIALFHTNAIAQSDQVFRMLRAMNMGGSRRVQKHYLLSNCEGHPRTFRADVNEDGSYRREGRAWVPDIQYVCRFLPSDFRGRVIRNGDVLEDCHIAFNFFGPLLEPSGIYRSQ